VAEFYHEYAALVASLGIRARLWPVPVELPDTLRFDEDRTHTSYDRDAAHTCWRVLAQCDRVFKISRGGFLGKSSPSHLWWGSFDLACTRFSGRLAPTHPGGIPNCPDYVAREAYSHECTSVGWWPGTAGGLEEPAFYAYAFPEPPGYQDAMVSPSGAYYHSGLREWILPYERVRGASNPDAALLAFRQLQEIGAVEEDAAAGDPAGRLNQPHDRGGRHRFAAARFADQAEGFAATHREAHSVHGAQAPPTDIEDGREVLHVEERGLVRWHEAAGQFYAKRPAPRAPTVS
jgi:hypothetical protein